MQDPPPPQEERRRSSSASAEKVRQEILQLQKQQQSQRLSYYGTGGGWNYYASNNKPTTNNNNHNNDDSFLSGDGLMTSRSSSSSYELGVGGGGGGGGGFVPPSPSTRSLREDFALPKDEDEEPTTTSSSRASKYQQTAVRILAWVIGVSMAVGLAMGMVALVDFMKANRIQLSPTAGTAGSSSSASLTLVTASELALHDSPQDCWIVYYAKVYEMSTYPKRRHPAGPGWITPWCGQDGTEAYSEFHSESLLRSVQGDIVGTYQEEEEEEDLSAVALAPPNDGGEDASDNNENGVANPQEGTSRLVDCSVEYCVTMEEVALHNTPDDCWLVLNDHWVYDLTYYAAAIHPAGAYIITSLAGTDATQEYARFHDLKLLPDIEQYLIGPMEGATIVNVIAQEEKVQQGTTSSDSSEEDGNRFRTFKADRRKKRRKKKKKGGKKTSEPTQAPVTGGGGGGGGRDDDDSKNKVVGDPVDAISLSELALHNTPGDCWMEVHGDVYNLTSYKHPGPDLNLCAVPKQRRGAFRRSLVETVQPPDQNLTTRFDQAANPVHPLSFLQQVDRVGTLIPDAGPISNPSPVSSPTATPVSTPVSGPITDPVAAPQGITMADVATHSTPTDCWVVLFGIAYDLTTYTHFGPPLCGAGKAGTDLTSAYLGANTQPTHNEALLTGSMSSYVVGPVVATDSGPPKVADPVPVANPTVAPVPAPTMPPTTPLTQSPTFPPTIADPVAAPQGITMADVATHSTPTDCWVVLFGIAYDLTTYTHFGPPLCGAGKAGTDLTSAYLGANTQPTHNEALLTGSMSSYVVGPVVATDSGPPKVADPVPVANPTVAPVPAPTMPPTTPPTKSPTVPPMVADPVAAPQGITMADVATHSTPTDCWVVLFGIAYDLTTYTHFGPPLCGAGKAGTDLTSAYLGANTQPTHNEALLTGSMSSYVVGPVVATDSGPPKVADPVPVANPTVAPVPAPTMPPTTPPTKSPTVPPMVADPVAAPQGITMADVATHSTPTDCWVVLFGIAYDLTTYTHFGPPLCGAGKAGTDLTSAYLGANTQPTHNEALLTGSMSSYVVGPVVATDSGPPKVADPVPVANPTVAPVPAPTMPPTTPPTKSPTVPPMVADPVAAPQGITMADVATHSTPTDCWVVLFGIAYDLTTYTHFGPPLCGAGKAGTDLTSAYLGANTQPTHNEALLTGSMSSYVVGPVVATDSGPPKVADPVPVANPTVAPVPAPTMPPTTPPTKSPTVPPMVADPVAAPQGITMADVATHSTPTDCWVVLFGIAYDLTTYTHFGPPLCGAGKAGTDLTSAYLGANTQPTHNEALLTGSMSSYVVGPVVATDSGPPKVADPVPVANPTVAPVPAPTMPPTTPPTKSPTVPPMVADPVAAPQGITMADVATHSTPTDCWVVLFGIAYDLTTYTHFGPPLCGAGKAGTDLTSAYLGANTQPTHNEALLTGSMSSYVVGPVVATDSGPPKVADPVPVANPTVAPVPAPTMPPTTPPTKSPTVPPMVADPVAAPQGITMADVATHSTPTDCWVVLFGIAYDLTTYTHFGPPLCGAGKAGTDLTSAYLGANTQPTHNEALLTGSMSSYVVGPVVATDSGPPKVADPVPVANPTVAPVPAPTMPPTTPPTKSPTVPPMVADPVAAPQGITMADVATHSTPTDCWVVLFGIAYDLTTYTHFGPPLCGAGKAGTDLTSAYLGANTQPTHNEALLTGSMSSYVVGPVVATDSGPPKVADPVPVANPTVAPVPAPTMPPTTPPTKSPTVPPTIADPVAAPQGITMADVATHSTPTDCWVVLFGIAYDLTTYTHFGPPLCGAGKAGTDLTSAYLGANTQPTHNEALLTGSMSSYVVGPVVATDSGPPKVADPVPVANPTVAPVPAPTMPPTTPLTQSPTFPPTIADPVAAPQGITMADVATHSTPTDCWVVFFNDAYDLTNYYHVGPNLCVPGKAGTNQTVAYLGVNSASAPPHNVGLLSSVLGNLIGPVVASSVAVTRPQLVADPILLTPITSSPTASPTTLDAISPTELSLHNTPEDCWMEIHGGVYNLTAYPHPGPGLCVVPSARRNLAGAVILDQSLTARFDLARSPSHPISFLTQVESLRVGTLLGSVPLDLVQVATPTTCVSRSTLQEHNGRDDCWIVVHGSVYDVSTYQHPGGRLDCGEDLTEDFDDEDEPRHTLAFLDMIASYMLGAYETNCAPGVDEVITGVGNDTPTALDSSGVTSALLVGHNSKNDCWVAIDGTVYDLSRYSHPGGDMKNCGSDITNAFFGARSSTPHTTNLLLGEISQYIVGPYLGVTAGGGGGGGGGGGVEGVVNSGNTITLAQLSTHSSKGKDCWTAYHGNVYDLSKFNHRGGNGYIQCGVDDTNSFSTKHSAGLLGSISNLKVGPLEGGSSFTPGGGGGGGGDDDDDDDDDSDD